MVIVPFGLRYLLSRYLLLVLVSQLSKSGWYSRRIEAAGQHDKVVVRLVLLISPAEFYGVGRL